MSTYEDLENGGDQEVEEKIEVTATYDRDSKRYHRYNIDEGKGIAGSVYIPKGENPICKEILIKLRVKT